MRVRFILAIFFLLQALDIQAQCRPDLIIRYPFTNNKKDTIRKIYNFYDSRGRLTSNLSYTRDSTGEPWRYESKEFFSANSMGLDSEYLLMTWDRKNMNWVNSYHTVTSYNSQGLKSELLIQYWGENKQWNNAHRQLWTYDANNRESAITTLWWSWDYSVNKNGWQNHDKIQYYYSGQNTLPDGYHYQEWDWQYSRTWKDETDVLYTYDSYGHMTRALMMATYTSPHYPLGRDSFTYNAQGLKVETLSQRWGASLANWFDDERETYEYDASGCMTHKYIHNHWLPYPQPPLRNLTEEYIYTGKKIDPIIYPNPVMDKLTVIVETTSAYTVWDINGRKVIAGTLIPGINTVDMAVFPVGIYILQTGGKNMKFIKE